MQRNILLSWLLAGLLLQGHASSWDVEYWQYLNVKNWERGPFKLYTTGEIRLNHDLRKVYYYRISECLAYKALKWLTLEAHYSYLYDIPTAKTRFSGINRLEFEINPSLDLGKRVTVSLRNRYELQKRQHSRWQSIFRQRATFAFLVSERCRTTWSCSNEIFINLNAGKFTQNRFRPLIVSFPLTRAVSLECFLMIRSFSKLSTGRWYNSVVLGSDIGF